MTLADINERNILPNDEKSIFFSLYSVLYSRIVLYMIINRWKWMRRFYRLRFG